MQQQNGTKEKVKEQFRKAGWLICDADDNKEVDFFLMDSNCRRVGWIDVFDTGSDRKKRDNIHKRAISIQKILNEHKPDLYILTDGVSYEIYSKGKYMWTTTTPIEMNSYRTLSRFMAYSKALATWGKDKEVTTDES
jgi:hypothetical protein